MPSQVQTAEFQYKAGMIDMIVPRSQMREMIEALVLWAKGRPEGWSAGEVAPGE
jgi:acetyl-CoA carboxylase beta subunit